MPGLGIGIGMGMGVGRAQASLFDRVLAEFFGNGEQGIYMPSVHESFVRGDLFQDVLGTTPVTAVGQSVGLWLDRSKGLVLGPELITNGDFSDGTTGWTPTQATILVTNGELETTSTFSNWGQAGRSVNLTPGRSYVLSGYVRKGTAGQRASVDIYDGEAQFTAINTSSGEASGAIVFVAKGAGGCVIKLNSWVTAIGQKSYFDNISLREISGNHASQPTAASRPTLQQDGNGMYVLRLDGVDDSLNVPGLDPLIEGVKPYEFVAAFNPDVDGQPAHSTSVLQKKHTVSPVSQTELTYIPSVDRGGINRFVAGTNVSINTADVVTKGVPTVFRWRYTGSRSEVGLNDSALAQGPEDTRDIGTSTAVSTAIGLSKVKGQIYGLVFIDRLLTGDEYTRLVLPLLRKSMGV